MITYRDLHIGMIDQMYIDNLIAEYDIDRSNLDITYAFENPDFNSTYLTNCILHEIMREIVIQNVEDQQDIFDLEESIKTNCLDSKFDIDPDRLRSEIAKQIVINF